MSAPGSISSPEAPRVVRHHRRPALDGVRAVAVAAVVAYHLDALQGGFVGVDVFFVMSGYLITTLLMRELLLAGWV